MATTTRSTRDYIGRFVDVTASPTTVTVFGDGGVIARHQRSWARHDVVRDPAHIATAAVLRREHQQRRDTARLQQQREQRQHADGHAVVLRALPDYDALFGIDPTDFTTTTRDPSALELGGHFLVTTTKTQNPEGMAGQLTYLTRVLKVPTIAACWEQLAEQAREANWSHEEYLAALLARQVADREAAGNTMRIRTAHFPAVKTLEDFNLDHLPSLRRDLLAHLATSTFVAKAENVILLGPPGIGKTHLAIGLGVKAAQAGHSVLFDTASNWIHRLAAAHHAGALEAELKKIRRYRLIIIDEVGYIPFDQDAANLFFQLVASRYEQASIMVTSNLPFGRWGETFSDDVVAAAMIDRLVHHAEVLTLAGDSYRTRARRELLAKDRTHND